MFEFARTRRFAPLFATQFLGAFNDNLFKTALVTLISFYSLGSDSGVRPEILVAISTLLFVLPYFLFSSISGQMSTRWNKATLAKATKIWEVLIMLVAAYGFINNQIWLLMGCLFMMGTQSTVFGPVKYAILPEYLPNKELLNGNSLIESGTFLAILLGQIFGALMVAGGTYVVVAVIVLVAILGTVTSFYMPATPPQNPAQKVQINIVSSTRDLLQQAASIKPIKTAIIGISWFWLVGSVYTTQLSSFAKTYLGDSEALFSVLLAMFSIGIGIGSILCAKLSHGRLNLRVVLWGAAGMAISGVLFAVHTFGLPPANPDTSIWIFLSQAQNYYLLGLLTLMGFFGGFFSVPLYTWLQTASSDAFRAQAVAANNIINGLFMVAGALISSVVIFVFDSLGLLFLILALGNIGIIYFLSRLSPEMLGNHAVTDTQAKQ
ncbi:putative MFS transporter [Vitreoscilla sp. C1]|uniref:MFS transporter n=1 Tax=Vitreoscilla sp. (strain C1) TaxID=96942 RepID=UPI000CDBF19A|nr:MFS transporter [Vitreoscilla sp. C1]AUZ04547.1 putative MFS transporter [Vitreoscilla sp. C1]